MALPLPLLLCAFEGDTLKLFPSVVRDRAVNSSDSSHTFIVHQHPVPVVGLLRVNLYTMAESNARRSSRKCVFWYSAAMPPPILTESHATHHILALALHIPLQF